AVSLPGVVALPVMLLLGAWLTMYGYAMVMRSFSMTFGAEAAPAPALLALVAGMVLLWLGIGAAGGSPYALVLPALVLLVFSAGFLVPGFFSMLPALMFSQTGGVLMWVVATATGAAIGIAMLVHTAVQRTVSSRARRRLVRPSAPCAAQHGHRGERGRDPVQHPLELRRLEPLPVGRMRRRDLRGGGLGVVLTGGGRSSGAVDPQAQARGPGAETAGEVEAVRGPPQQPHLLAVHQHGGDLAQRRVEQGAVAAAPARRRQGRALAEVQHQRAAGAVLV